MPTVMYKRNRYFLERKKYVIFSFKNCLNQKKKKEKKKSALLNAYKNYNLYLMKTSNLTKSYRKLSFRSYFLV